ncbi:MAG: hypothetical protein BWY67_00996 [Bacteroidetes bacterium ADurb.Bin397]|nr:MAG: hypothetical protein BWY67_00996 [Bacteroidetes bacterium ADurb.Bin397]
MWNTTVLGMEGNSLQKAKQKDSQNPFHGPIFKAKINKIAGTPQLLVDIFKIFR